MTLNAWGGGPYQDPKPDCSNGGPHRFKQAHALPQTKNMLYQTCRICGEIKFTQYKVVDGKVLTENVTPTP